MGKRCAAHCLPPAMGASRRIITIFRVVRRTCCMPRLSTAEATVETLLRHGLDTIYALPGLHNDPLFDAF